MTTMELVDEATAALRRLVGNPDAELRAGQLDAITALVAERRRVLVVQRTGWGKSAVYFVTTALLRARGAGPTLLVSPLLGLMRNQIEAAERGGLRAVTINSDNQDDWQRVAEALTADAVDLLLVSPERFANPAFRARVLPTVAPRTGLLVIDEVHCISDWGHDFRPDYRRLARVLDLLPRGVPVLGTTATANDRVVADVQAQLGEELLTIRGPLDRESLVLDAIELRSQPERLAWLAQVLPTLEGTGIVYTLTIADAQRVAEWLGTRGIAARAYTGDTDTATKLEIEADLSANRIKAVVATSALGMGYDKPDLAFVVHYQSPGSPIAYYQQVGRAGRGIERATGILLSGHEDRDIQDYFIRAAFPPREQAEAVVALLADAADWVPVHRIEDRVNVRRSRLAALLKNLEVDGAVERDGAKHRRTHAPWAYDEARAEGVTAQRRREQETMRAYATTGACLMELLRLELDDPTAGPCGRCSRCTGDTHAVALDPAVVLAAQQFLRGEHVAVSPRKRYADLTVIPKQEQLAAAWALARWGDGGWGGRIRAEKPAGAFTDVLVDALVGMLREHRPDPPYEWVTAIPSRRTGDLVPSLAAGVAARLDLPYLAVLTKVRDTPPQVEMDNSAQQSRNVGGAFELTAPVPPTAGLIVDDVWDSGWTMTVVAQLLRSRGSGPVYGAVLAQATGA